MPANGACEVGADLLDGGFDSDDVKTGSDREPETVGVPSPSDLNPRLYPVVATWVVVWIGFPTTSAAPPLWPPLTDGKRSRETLPR